MENKTITQPKTVIFRHPAAAFKLDDNIRRNAMYINKQKQDDKDSLGNYFLAAMKAADSEKQYVVIDYDQQIARFLKLLMTYSYGYRYTNWSFITFFHDDAVGTNQTRRVIPEDQRRSMLKDMSQFNYIAKHAIAPDYTVTEQDIKAIRDFWKAEEDINSSSGRLTVQRKPPFPFYDCNTELRRSEGQNEESRVPA